MLRMRMCWKAVVSAPFKWALTLLLAGSWLGLSAGSQLDIGILKLPDVEPVVLKPYAQIVPGPVDESSGIVKSRQFDGVYWTHNDSGDGPIIYPITKDGAAVQSNWARKNGHVYNGLRIEGAVNIDWEDIAIDENNNLIIGAFGNNLNARRDLAVYILPEPNPEMTLNVRFTRRIDFHFPEQKAFPPTEKQNRNFDCEAVFAARKKLYFLSKNRGDNWTSLYRMDEQEPYVSNPLKFLGRFCTRDWVTAADATPDGRRLAVLTTEGVWVFEVKRKRDDYFTRSKVYWLPIKAKQCEAICWENDEMLLITNEQRQLFSLELSDLRVVRK